MNQDNMSHAFNDDEEAAAFIDQLLNGSKPHRSLAEVAADAPEVHGEVQVGDEVNLSPDQADAVNRILTSTKTYQILTGQAGSGKSTVLNYLMRKHAAEVAVCATTGRAAVANGSMMTVDGMFGIKRSNYTRNDRRARLSYVYQDIIGIDEASMIGSAMFGLIDEGAYKHDKRVLMVGDWTQAKPVKDEWITESHAFRDVDIIKLTKNHRQGEGDYLTALNKIRVMEIDEQVNRTFKDCICPEPPKEEGWLRMFATNQLADHCNRMLTYECAERHNFQPFPLSAHYEDCRPDHLKSQYPLHHGSSAKAFDEHRMCKSAFFTPYGQVVITVNAPAVYPDAYTVHREYVNGDTGTLEDVLVSDRPYYEYLPDPNNWKEGSSTDLAEPFGAPKVSRVLRDGVGIQSANHVMGLVIRLHRTGNVVTIMRKVAVNFDTVGKRDFLNNRVSGIPVLPGYALTIHRAQGATVDKAWFDMSSIRSMYAQGQAPWHGLAYVGLSRTRTLEGLRIDSWDPSTIQFDERVRALI